MVLVIRQFLIKMMAHPLAARQIHAAWVAVAVAVALFFFFFFFFDFFNTRTSVFGPF
jgi:hypothetical protein